MCRLLCNLDSFADRGVPGLARSLVAFCRQKTYIYILLIALFLPLHFPAMSIPEHIPTVFLVAATGLLIVTCRE